MKHLFKVAAMLAGAAIFIIALETYFDDRMAQPTEQFDGP